MSKTQGKGAFNSKKKTKTKKQKTKQTEEQAPMRDYREALLADMKGLKAIDKFCLCSVTLQVFKG